VIGPEERAALVARSPYNVVGIDLPADPAGGDPYAHAAALLAEWRAAGIVVRDEHPAIWVLEQEYTGPDGRAARRRGFLARIRVEPYGPGRVRPHERTHPGPKEDRLRLTRATRANLSPIFALYDDPQQAAWAALERHATGEPWGQATDDDGTIHRVWRVSDPGAIAAVREALTPSELLIADGHHRYETARVYAEEIGGEGEHNHVLACLVALQDPGLTIFPTHRLITDLDDGRRKAFFEAVERDWDLSETTDAELQPHGDASPVEIGFLDNHNKRPARLRLKDQGTADAALPGKPQAYRQLDTAVLEALVLQGLLGMTEDDISHFNGLDYSRTTDEAKAKILSGEVDAGFFMGPVPVERVQAIAAAGEVMPPKSTYFFPKVLTGLLFNPLDEG
jgi:uncharacterized protein (DUF1015 family)